MTSALKKLTFGVGAGGRRADQRCDGEQWRAVGAQDEPGFALRGGEWSGAASRRRAEANGRVGLGRPSQEKWLMEP